MTFERLETERLILLKLDPKKMIEIFELNDDEKIKEILGITDEEEFIRQKKINHYGYESYNRKILSFKIVEKQSGKKIGNISFHTWNPQHHRAEVGYDLFLEEFKRKGYMKEALGKVLEFGFEELDLNRIEALIDDANTPSKRLLEHYGFSKEGITRGHYLVDGVFEDSVLYSLLKSEYQK